MLRDFWKLHPSAELPLRAWYGEVVNATWTQPADIKAQYPSAGVLKNRRVVFNIKGNDYRLIVAVSYKLQIIVVESITDALHPEGENIGLGGMQVAAGWIATQRPAIRAVFLPGRQPE